MQWFYPGLSGSDLDYPVLASIVSANPSTTVLSLACPTDLDASDCGFGPHFDYSVISTTIYEATMSIPDEFTMAFSCDHDTAKTQMACDISMGGPNANDPGQTSGVLSGSDVDFFTATITAGEEKLSATGRTQNSDAAPSQASATATSAGETGAPASIGSATSGLSGSGATTKPTNAAYRVNVEGSALLALAGAAAVVAL
ncbi:hypothetical protein CC78DRAFT_532680 [Lojkania enalia]|uniref:Uncharacterized protein n=1 Tax=Lojkania enalia TaxID=147567 RepID=A0A9P4KC51_9PLEO|nr:hypothetical protein CC78DRAFT_532680 [Didymosphaeria enalia]